MKYKCFTECQCALDPLKGMSKTKLTRGGRYSQAEKFLNDLHLLKRFEGSLSHAVTLEFWLQTDMK